MEPKYCRDHSYSYLPVLHCSKSHFLVIKRPRVYLDSDKAPNLSVTVKGVDSACPNSVTPYRYLFPLILSAKEFLLSFSALLLFLSLPFIYKCLLKTQYSLTEEVLLCMAIPPSPSANCYLALT